jgi:hypothetical protein
MLLCLLCLLWPLNKIILVNLLISPQMNGVQQYILRYIVGASRRYFDLTSEGDFNTSNVGIVGNQIEDYSIYPVCLYR